MGIGAGKSDEVGAVMQPKRCAVWKARANSSDFAELGQVAALLAPAVPSACQRPFPPERNVVRRLSCLIQHHLWLAPVASNNHLRSSAQSTRARARVASSSSDSLIHELTAQWRRERPDLDLQNFLLQIYLQRIGRI